MVNALFALVVVLVCGLILLGADRLDQPAKAFRRDCEAAGAQVVHTSAGPRCAKLELVRPLRTWSD